MDVFVYDANESPNPRSSPKEQNEDQAPRSPQYQPPELWRSLKFSNSRYRALKSENSFRKNSLIETDLIPQKLSFEEKDEINKIKAEKEPLTEENANAVRSCPITNLRKDTAPDVCNNDTFGLGESEEILLCRSRREKSSESTETYNSIEDGDHMSGLLRDKHEETKKNVQNQNKSKSQLIETQESGSMTEDNVKDLQIQNEKHFIEIEQIERFSKNTQTLVLEDFVHKQRRMDNLCQKCQQDIETPFHELEINQASTVSTDCNANTSTGRSNSVPALFQIKNEIDLTRSLNESYDMQEKLVADNAELEAKRYTLVKELITKDQNLETCRAHIKVLKAELKLINKENYLLREKLIRNGPEGDALSEPKCHQEFKEQERVSVDKNQKELKSELDRYKIKNQELQKEIASLRNEVRHFNIEMDKRVCRGTTDSCFPHSVQQAPVSPKSKSCTMYSGQQCPAPCNANSGPTPGDKEIQKLQIQLRQTEENFKTKVTECAILRTDFQKLKAELEKERCLHREVAHKLRDLEMKFEGLTAQTNSLLGTKEQAFEQEVNVKALKQCYREARDEIEELRLLMKEQNDQLQDYRVKYLQAQQLVEEQRRQMDIMDMDNARISEQINLEIQRVKIIFQEKLQELAPIPDLLRSTQIKLKDAQQNQAIAEHNAEQLARELNSAREKIHMLLHSKMKPIEKPAQDKSSEEKQIALASQRISQLTEMNTSYKNEIERLKGNVIRMEEAVLAHEKRLQEKLHECAQLGGELDRTRDEAARALQRASERTETIRKCMQTSVAELERQLAAARAQVKVAEKDKEQVQARMHSQIQRLNENFEQAQLRILGLQTQVQTLKRTVSSTGEGEGDNEECTCKNFFE